MERLSTGGWIGCVLDLREEMESMIEEGMM